MREIFKKSLTAAFFNNWENRENENFIELIIEALISDGVVNFRSSAKIGQKFGKWTILENLGKRGTHQYYLCRCSCGQTKEVCGSNLSSGKSKSCGCYDVEEVVEAPKPTKEDVEKLVEEMKKSWNRS